MPKSLEALPGRVILKFGKPVEKKGLIHIPQTSQLRPELGEIVSIGTPLTTEDWKTVKELERIQMAGGKIAVSYASGISYWREYEGQSLDVEEWGFLKDLRAYRISELAAYIEETP